MNASHLLCTYSFVMGVEIDAPIDSLYAIKKPRREPESPPFSLYRKRTRPMGRKAKNPTEVQKKRDWLPIMVTILIAALTLLMSNLSLQETKRNNRAARQAKLKEYLDEALASLGGKENTGIIYTAQKDPNKLENAHRLINSVLREDPRNARALRLKGMYLIFAGSARRAVDVLHESLNIEPCNVNAYIYVGFAYRELKRLDESTRAYQQALSCQPESADLTSLIYHNLAQVYSEQGRHEATVEAYRKAIENDPNRADERNSLGMYYLSRSDYENAISEFKKAQSIDGNNYKSFQNLGLAYLAKESLQEAELAFSEALVRSPDSETSLLGLGDTFLARNDIRGAEIYYRKALNLGSSEARARIAALRTPARGFVPWESQSQVVAAVSREPARWGARLVQMPGDMPSADGLEPVDLLARPKATISGIVTDRSNRPLRGAKIRVFQEPEGERGALTWVDEASTDQSGRYKMKIPLGGSFLLLFSRAEDLYIGVVRSVIEKGEVEISATLSSVSIEKSETDRRDHAIAVETFFAASRIAPLGKRKEMAAELLKILDRINPPDDLVQRVSEMRQALLAPANPNQHTPPPEAPQEYKLPGTVWVISDDPPRL